jgi:hypothetical protein
MTTQIIFPNLNVNARAINQSIQNVEALFVKDLIFLMGIFLSRS